MTDPRAIRRRLGWTQRQMAAHHGVGASTVRGWERYGVPSCREAAWRDLEASIREPETLGEKLRLLRLGLGWNAEEMANTLDVSLVSIYRYERNERTPGEDVLRCCRLLEGER